MTVFLVPHWLPMIRIYPLYNVVTLTIIYRILCLIIAYAIMTVSANALSEDVSLTSCEIKDFNNVYYLIDKNDFYSATIFFQKIDVIDSEKDTKYESLIGEKDSSSTYYDFDDLALLKEKKELVYNLDKDLLDFFPGREQIIYIDKQTIPVNCIERGRWSYMDDKIFDPDNVKNFGLTSKMMSRKVRSTLYHAGSSQGSTWNSIR